MKPAILLLVAFLCATALRAEDKIILVQSKDTTSKDIPLTFELEKTEVDKVNDLQIWGTIRNESDVTFDLVKITFTTRDKQKKFLGRDEWYCEPSTLRKGDAGYITAKFVAGDSKKAAILEYKITGSANQ